MRIGFEGKESGEDLWRWRQRNASEIGCTGAQSPRALCSLSSEGHEELVGHAIADVNGTEALGTYRRQVEQVCSGAKAVHFEHEIRTPEGLRYHTDTLYPIVRDGKLSAIGGICSDITEHRQPEIREQLARDALLASEGRYRRLFEAARDGILILDAETGMVGLPFDSALI